MSERHMAMDPALAALQWYLEAGVDEAIQTMPRNRLAEARTAPAHQPAPAQRPAPAHRPAPFSPSGPDSGMRPPPPAAAAAPTPSSPDHQALAAELAGIPDLDGLRRRLERYDGCVLKETATHTVFGEGPADARLMLIGEAPGEEEDRHGRPFVGPSGKLLDRMLAAIGLERDQVYIANTLYWRPPGNRTPTPQEVLACQPFLQRQIALIRPQIIVLVGGAAAKTLLGRREGITRLRGRWMACELPASAGEARSVPALATLHPAYLLRSPAAKREAWQDLLAIQERLHELAG